MNETERAYKIGKAACDGHPTITDHWDSLDEILQSSWIDEGLAAVRAAYEIDGVRELVEAVDRLNEVVESCQQILAKNLLPDAVSDERTVHDLFGVLDDILTMDLQHQASAAAARVREAMGGQ